MAEPLKLFFNRKVVTALAAELQRAHPSLDGAAFVRQCMSGLDDLELTGRAAHIAAVMAQHLPAEFPAAAAILIASLGPEHDGSDSFGMAPFRYLPHTLYVAQHGLQHFEAAMQAQYELTKRFTAEGSIRAFLLAHPEATYQRLLTWARDPSVHVRRLVSEGTRPLLPWARRLPQFRADPRPVLRLLELLKDDPERYVQRSVANNLNDIGKDHPALVVQVCRAWLADAPPGRRWIVKHALRSLIKKGEPGALALLGFGAAPKIRIEAVRLAPKRLRIGDTLQLGFDVVSTAAKPQELLVDYAVHFVKARGTASPKVFKLRKVRLGRGEQQRIETRLSFADKTTRKHHPGKHVIELLVNGVRYPLGHVTLQA